MSKSISNLDRDIREAYRRKNGIKPDAFCNGPE